MIEHMMADVICEQFEKSADKGQFETGKALHIGFGLSCSHNDQYNVVHMYLYAPMNYVYVAIQSERITEGGDRVVGDMEILSYHDSCWRDAVKNWIFKNRKELCVFKSYKLFRWYDEIVLTEEEKKHLSFLEQCRFDEKVNLGVNPFDNRGIWDERQKD